MTKWLQQSWLNKPIVVMVMLIFASDLVVGCGPIAPEPTSTPASFSYSVRVQAEDTGEPIPKAEVKIEVGGKATLDEITDSNGYARILIDSSHIGQPGKLIVEATDYERYEKNIDLTEGNLPEVIPLQKESGAGSLGPPPTMSLSDTVTPTIPIATPSSAPLSTPIPASTPTTADIPTPSYLAPILVSPASETTIMREKLTDFSWQWDGVLQKGEGFDVRIWRPEKPRCTVAILHERSCLLDTPPDGFGRYLWQVAVVQIDESGELIILSESSIWSFVWSDATSTSTFTAGPTPTSTNTQTLTPTVPPTPLTATVTHAPGPPTPTTFPTATPQLAPITLTIYLGNTLVETGVTVNGGERYTGVTALGDQAKGVEIYKEGIYVYGNAAVQIGATTYHFDKPEEEVGPGEPKQLPDSWQVEFEFAELLLARTGNVAGFDPKKAQFWVGTLDGHSAVGEKSPYSLTMKLYEENEERESIQVFFTVKDAPGDGGDGNGDGDGGNGGGGTDGSPRPPSKE